MATIIKRGAHDAAPAGDAVRGVAFDLQDMTGHGEEYLAQVRREATKIVQQANADAEAVRSKAEAAGRQAAEQAIDQVLQNKLAEQMRTLRPALQRAVQQIESDRAAWLNHWEQAAVELAKRIAERIVRRELAAAPEITAAWAREALELVAGASEVTVRLHPTDHANLGDQVEALAAEIGQAGGSEVVADSGVSPGGCVVATRHGVIDAQVEAQLDRLVAELE